MDTVADIQRQLKEKLANKDFVVDKSGVKMIEILGAAFIANEDVIFGKLNEDYICREIEWYESESLYVDDIPGETPKIWSDVSSRHGRINSNYGYLLYSPENGLQYNNVLNALHAHEETRQAVAVYTRPSIHADAFTDGMKDFICTNTVQYLIRDNKIHAVVNMRSNDVIFGFRNDLAWQKHVLAQLVREYEKFSSKRERYEVGDIFWQVGSLHVYERHFNLIK